MSENEKLTQVVEKTFKQFEGLSYCEIEIVLNSLKHCLGERCIFLISNKS